MSNVRGHISKFVLTAKTCIVAVKVHLYACRLRVFENLDCSLIYFFLPQAFLGIVIRQSKQNKN